MITRVKKAYEIAGSLGKLGQILAARAAGRTVFAMTPPGAAHPVSVRFGTSDIPTYQKVFVEQDYALDLPSPPETVIDGGANVGFAAVYFALKWPHARIVAVEPESGNFDQLRRNVAPYPNILPIRAALWPRDEMLCLVDPGLGSWGFRVEEGDVSSAGGVRGVSMEALSRELGVRRIDVLKLDIEGSEREMFAGGCEWMEAVGVVVVETHDHYRLGCSRNYHGATCGFDWEWTQGENLVSCRASHAPRMVPPHAVRLRAGRAQGPG